MMRAIRILALEAWEWFCALRGRIWTDRARAARRRLDRLGAKSGGDHG